ncbi:MULTISPECIES: antirestriction protein ArdA [Aeromonas]|uniref:antirestriction protein ArdA n=1 Tax=Aeromonas TaxID=642 RepID=UPI001E51F44D|nr:MULTISPECIES: antirestriction protein ArdA [Aeromonas]
MSALTTTGYGLEHVHTTAYGSTYKCKTLNGNPLSEDMQDYITLKWDDSGFVDAGSNEPAIWAGTPVTGEAKERFTDRAVAALDAAGTGEHNVYVHWFRIDYGCWLDAEEVVSAGGLADYLETLGLSAADVSELMAQDWDCQDAEGLASRFLGNYGGFDWLGFEELLEITTDTDEAVVLAALDAGIPANEAGEKFIGEWKNSEDMAYDQWEQGGMLDAVPEAVRIYIDWGAVARDMLLSGIVENRGYYFHAC